MLSSIAYGAVPGLLLAAVAAASGAESIPGALVGLFLAVLLFGVPWVLACLANGVVLTAVRSGLGVERRPTILGVAAVVGLITTGAFYVLFLSGLLTEQQNCDSVCLGLEQSMLGRPFWHWILFSLWVGALFQALPMSAPRAGSRSR